MTVGNGANMTLDTDLCRAASDVRVYSLNFGPYLVVIRLA
jgi:hypothetical protein